MAGVERSKPPAIPFRGLTSFDPGHPKERLRNNLWCRREHLLCAVQARSKAESRKIYRFIHNTIHRISGPTTIAGALFR